MAYFHYLLESEFPDYVLNLKLIWDKQRLPDDIEIELMKLAQIVFKHITDENRKITNVTEWCKKEECWKQLQAKKYELSSNIINYLIPKSEEKQMQKEGKKEQKMVNAIAAQTEVIQLGQIYWEKLLSWGRLKKVISDIDESFILSATKIELGRIPTEKQSQRILNIKQKLIEEGFEA